MCGSKELMEIFRDEGMTEKGFLDVGCKMEAGRGENWLVLKANVRGAVSVSRPSRLASGRTFKMSGRICSIREERDPEVLLRLPRTVRDCEARVNATYRRFRLSTVF